MPATELVAGDVLELEAGDAIPADARLLQTANVAAEESALTGESVPVGKEANAPRVATTRPSAIARTWSSSARASCAGARRAIVIATGPRTEIGKLSTLIQGAGQEPTPLEQKLETFGKKILWTCLALSALLFTRGYLAHTAKLQRAPPRGGEPRGRRDPRGPAGDHDDHARPRHAAHGQARRDHPQARRGRDARRGDRHLLRQDRHAHAERDDRSRGARRGHHVRRHRRRLRSEGRHPAPDGQERHRPARDAPPAPRDRRALQQRDAREEGGQVEGHRRSDRGRAPHARREGKPPARVDQRAGPEGAAVRQRPKAHDGARARRARARGRPREGQRGRALEDVLVATRPTTGRTRSPTRSAKSTSTRPSA